MARSTNLRISSKGPRLGIKTDKPSIMEIRNLANRFNYNIRILLDCRGLRYEKRGIGNYTRGLYAAMLRLKSIPYNVRLLAYESQTLEFNKPLPVVRIPEHKAQSSEILDQIIKDANVAVFLSATWFCIRVPMPNPKSLYPVECKVIVHDLIPLQRNETTPVYRARLESLRKCTSLYANSSYTAHEHRSVGLRCDVLGTGTERAKELPGKVEIDRVKIKFGITRRFIFYQAAVDGHKGIASLIREYLELDTHIRSSTQLVLGMSNPRKVLDKKAPIPHRDIVVTGWLSTHDKSALHQGAWLYVSPSEAEGFGMTIAESISRGIPTIVADNTAQRELITDKRFRFGTQRGLLTSLITSLHNNHAVYKQCEAHSVDRGLALDSWSDVAARLVNLLSAREPVSFP